MRLEFFDMIDQVSHLDLEGSNLVAHATVPEQSPVFEGHFPGHPLVPGVLLTETMAQASGYLILLLSHLETMPFLMGIEKARFRTFVEPCTALQITARCTQKGSGYSVTQSAIYFQSSDTRDTPRGALVCTAELRFAHKPFPGELRSFMQTRMARLGCVDVCEVA
jgi:3-hydroxyacyl-[acyl-carrier-protein] dehydratase